MKRFTPELDDMPLPLRCLSAYAALAAVAMAILAVAEFLHDPSAWAATPSSWSIGLWAIALFAGAHLLTVRERWAWKTTLGMTVVGMGLSFLFQTTGFVLATTVLIVLALPSTRAFMDESPTTTF